MIRPARPGDAEAVARAHVQAWEETYRGLLPDDIIDGQTFAKRHAFWQGLLADPGASRVFVAETETGIAGFGSALPARNHAPAQITALYLQRDSQRRGLGCALLTACLDAIRATGPRAIVEVLETNTLARAFYEQMGAVETSREADPRGFTHVIYSWEWP
ncbi:N-acetyltransferase family protein [Tropicibacter sp. S64]|uniref:GNAT family N-acetyltransferase n=1 Tax=Tropicibacter sp. S64 TaxID=3415122 RepID=UPI003C79DB29